MELKGRGRDARRRRALALRTASPSAATGAVSDVLENRIPDVESVVQLGAAAWVLLQAALARTACADRDEQRLYQWARQRGCNLARDAREARKRARQGTCGGLCCATRRTTGASSSCARCSTRGQPAERHPARCLEVVGRELLSSIEL